MKRFSTFALFVLVAALVALPVLAQEQTGAIEGTVKDNTGAVLPGVTVELTSASIGTLATTTGANGMYRFPRVPSGVYAVKASLMGYTPAEVQRVDVQLGKTVTVDLGLALGTVTESITVTADAPLVDVTSSATAASISREQIELVPRGRDFSSVVSQAAGAQNEGFAGGISVDGASGSENRFVIDGVDTTHPQNGDQGQALITDFVEEVQVKSAGYQAEYGGSIGGVINAITKSGTNNFAGSVGTYYGDSSWDGDKRVTPEQGAGTPPSYLYKLYDVDDTTRIEPFASIGGPIIRDALWFYLGASQSEFETDRTPVGQSAKTQTDQRRYVTGNLKGNLGSRFLYKLAGNYAPRTVDNALPASNGTTSPTLNLDIDTKFKTASYSAYADFIPNPSFYVTGRAGFYTTDTKTEGTGVPAFGTPRIFFRDNPFPDASDSRYRPAGFATIPAAVHTSTEKDLWERESGSLDASYFVTALGQHAFKGGVQYETVSNDVATGEPGNLFEVRWGLPDRFGAGIIGQYGSVHVRRFGTFGAVESKNTGFYLQDSWTVIPDLTLNLGVRTEKEEVPNYGHGQDPSLPVNAFEFGYGDKLAPRLGFSWNVLDNQKMKVYGSWGMYYDIMKLEMSRGSFGGDRWIAYLYPLNTLDWASLPNGCHTSENDPADNPCPALGNPERLDLRHPTDPRDPIEGIDPSIEPFQQEEYQLGTEYLLTTNSMVGARYVNKSVKKAIEDIGFFACESAGNCFESYFVGNPGFGQTANDPPGPIPGQPKAVRDYEALELSYTRRFVKNWSARVSYTYSKLEGNWSGLGSSDEFGRTDPNVSRSFDALWNSFGGDAKPVFGVLNTDRPHQLDAQFIYRTPWKTSIGINEYYGSGTPISTQVTYSGVPFFAFGRGDAGRTDALNFTDLLLTHPLTVGPVGLEFSLNVLNVFDQDTAQLIDPNYSRTDLCTAIGSACTTARGQGKAAEYFFANIASIDIKSKLDNFTNAQGQHTLNPYYLKANAGGSTADPFQTRRTVRLGVKLTF